MPALVALFVVYVVVVTWQMRRAVAASDVAVRQREARRLLFVVSAGVPLLGAFVWVVM